MSFDTIKTLDVVFQAVASQDIDHIYPVLCYRLFILGKKTLVMYYP
jgi:hypothetical protein